MKLLTSCLLPILAISSLAPAQSNIDSINKFSWSENCGWMNWRDAGSPAGTAGVMLAGTYASGAVWCENIGWVRLGTTPANGTSFSNLSAADFGVNILPNQLLGGFAWSENTGWINFGPFSSLPANQQARLSSGRLWGYAWGENIGWINMNDSTRFVGLHCRADFNQDGVVDFFDYLDFVDAFSAAHPSSDFNSDTVIDFFDYLDFVDAFSAGC